jgi:hypothetical protein
LGIGTALLSEYSLRILKNISGATISYGVRQEGAVQSSVTTAAIGFNNTLNTQAATFTLVDYHHYFANQSALGAGSAITNQYGFFVNSNLTGATNNYGFYGNIPAAANRWNLFMNGTAANYLAGVLNIGTTTLSGFSLDVNGTARVQDNITISKNANAQTRLDINNTTSGALSVSGIQITSDATSGQFSVVKYSTATTSYKTLASRDAIIFNNSTAGNISILNDFASGNINFAAGGSSTAQLTIASTGASTFSNSVTAASFIPTSSTIPTNGMYLSGTNTLGFATNGTLDMTLDANGAVGIGTTSLTGYSLRVNKQITGNTDGYGIANTCQANSDVTSTVRSFFSDISTQATSYTLSAVYHYWANRVGIGAGSTVTTQIGFFASSGMTTATNNRGFMGSIPAASNNYNLFMDGTANNYLAGSLGIGTTGLTGYTLRTSKNITGAVTSYGVTSEGQIQSDVTSSARMFWTLPSIIGGHAITDVFHFITGQGTFNGTATNQYGFVASSSLTGATNNFGFWGNVPSGTNRWNLYMTGTAANYMAGNLGIGTTSINARLESALSTSNGVSVSLRITNSSAASVSPGQGVQMDFVNDNGFNASVSSSAIRSITTSTANGGADLLFLNYNGSALTEYMRISRLGKVGIATSSINASARLQVDSTTEGFLPPRMTTTQKNAIGTPAAGLMVYDTTLNQMSYYNGTTWINF